VPLPPGGEPNGAAPPAPGHPATAAPSCPRVLEQCPRPGHDPAGDSFAHSATNAATHAATYASTYTPFLATANTASAVGTS